jgi:hypothetical protein
LHDVACCPAKSEVLKEVWRLKLCHVAAAKTAGDIASCVYTIAGGKFKSRDLNPTNAVKTVRGLVHICIQIELELSKSAQGIKEVSEIFAEANSALFVVKMEHINFGSGCILFPTSICEHFCWGV